MSNPNSSSNVHQLFSSKEQYNGQSGIADLDKKVQEIGLDEIKQLRRESYNVSNLVYVIILSAMTLPVLVSGCMSVVTGALMGGGNPFLSVLYALFMGVVQLCIFAVGNVAGCSFGKSSNRRALGLCSLILGLALMIVSITTGLAFLYFVQDLASQGKVGQPINHFFSTVAASSEMFSTAAEVQTAFNIFCVIVFELTVFSAPILFKVFSSPMREKWESAKLIKANLAIEENKRRFSESIAMTKNLEQRLNAEIYRSGENTKMQARSSVLANRLKHDEDVRIMFSRRNGLIAHLIYKLTGHMPNRPEVDALAMEITGQKK